MRSWRKRIILAVIAWLAEKAKVVDDDVSSELLAGVELRFTLPWSWIVSRGLLVVCTYHQF